MRKFSEDFLRDTANRQLPTVLITNKHNKSQDTAVKAYIYKRIRLIRWGDLLLKVI